MIERRGGLEAVASIRGLYEARTPEPRSYEEVVGESRRTWDLCQDAELGKNAVERALDPIPLRDQPQKEAYKLGKVLDQLVVTSWEKSATGCAASFATRVSVQVCVRRLLKLWESATFPDTVLGFIRRFDGDLEPDRTEAFAEHWDVEKAPDLDEHEARRLAQFLSPERAFASPKASLCPAVLLKLMRNKVVPPLDVTNTSMAASASIDAEPDLRARKVREGSTA